MMTRKDFELIAREFGWDFHLYDLRYDFNAHKVTIVLPSHQQFPMANTDDLKCIGMTAALFTITKAFTASNPNFKVIVFYKAINDYADRADEIGNGIFK